MRIAFDAKRITHNETGLGTYGRVLVNNLAAYRQDNSYFLYSTDAGKSKLRNDLKRNHSIHFSVSKKNRF